MTQFKIDKPKVDRMVRDTLMQFNNSAVHPAEMVIALAECIGRVINQVPGTVIVTHQLMDLAIKHMAETVAVKHPEVMAQAQ